MDFCYARVFDFLMIELIVAMSVDLIVEMELSALSRLDMPVPLLVVGL